MIRVEINVTGPAQEADLLCLVLAEALRAEAATSLYGDVDAVVRSLPPTVPGKE